ncbi:MAG: acyl-CoA/acyl-ACP dehydrogenase [Planctomycetes bacterium]|nr:acyl-CoA/acyl-ACP dehydrogenase [Planctomycetota bacterium]
MPTPLEQLTRNLAKLATHYDMLGEWPAQSLELLGAAGGWTWAIPQRFGGLGLDPASQMLAYEAVAAGSMSCALILTQRDGACEFIVESDNEEAKSALLPKLNSNSVFATIGISHLTTSLRAGSSALTAVREDDHYILNGCIPWVTGAVNSDCIVTAALEPGVGQILVCLPVSLEGVQIDAPMKLMAVENALTSEVHCRNVRISREHLLRKSAADVLKRRSPVKSLVVAATGIGLAGALIRDIQVHAVGADSKIREFAEEAGVRYAATRERIMGFAAELGNENSEIPKTELRVAVNDLLLRLAIAATTVGKGSGFIRQRDTQRLAREAMFFLVWSATEDVRVKSLASFLERPEPEIRSMPL